MGITPASTAELTSVTVRKIAVIRLILLMLFIILISFLVLAFLGFPPWEVISGRSVRYLVKFCGALRGKLERQPRITRISRIETVEAAVSAALRRMQAAR